MSESVWHILRVKSGTEVAVAAACGFVCFVPLYVRSYFNRRLRKNVSYKASLLPGFVFVKIERPSDFVVAPSAQIYGFMRNGDRTPAVLSDKAFTLLGEVTRELRETNSVDNKVSTFEVGQGISLQLPMGVAQHTVEAIISEIRDGRIFAEVAGSQLRVEVSHLDAIAA